MIVYIIWMCILVSFEDGKLETYTFQSETQKECETRMNKWITYVNPIILSTEVRSGKCVPVLPRIYYESREK